MHTHCACLYSSYKRDTAKSHYVSRPGVRTAVKVHTQVRRALHLRIKSDVQSSVLAKYCIDTRAL